MVEIVRKHGAERLIVDSACDWGISDPLSVPKTAMLLAEQGISPEDVQRVTYGNALSAYGQSGQMREADWAKAEVDQRSRYDGNTVLRGGQAPRVEAARNSGTYMTSNFATTPKRWLESSRNSPPTAAPFTFSVMTTTCISPPLLPGCPTQCWQRSSEYRSAKAWLGLRSNAASP